MIKNIESKNAEIKINDKEILVLKEYFSSCFTKDGSIDFTRLQEQLTDKVDIIHDGYELKFLGKCYAKLLASIDTTTIIKPDTEHNEKPENKNSENIYISGDNLDGLKHLLKSYSKQVKCIYIDPPYNTGNDGFVYNDDFNFTNEELQTKLSIDETQAKRILDLTKRNSASHSAWLLFMYSRLQLARDLLKKDGVIFISIDDNEQANLKLLCDDVFGEENFINNIVWHSNPGGDKGDGVETTKQYILTYCRKRELINNLGVQVENSISTYTLDDSISKYKKGSQLEKWGNGDAIYHRPNLGYSIYYNAESAEVKIKFDYNVDELNDKNKSGVELKYESPDAQLINLGFSCIRPRHTNSGLPGRWRMQDKTFLKRFGDNEFIFEQQNGTLKIYEKERFKNNKLKKAKDFIDSKIAKQNQSEIMELFGGKVFDYPKPTQLIEYLLKNSINDVDIVCDFFSGSATTGQTVLKLNSEDEGNRKFILVQLPESIDASNVNKKATLDFLTSVNRPITLDYIGIERIIRAAKKIKEETTADIDYGFKHFELCEANQNTLDKCESFDKSLLIADSSILDEFGTSTVLTTWLVNDGYGFNAEVKAIDLKGYTAYYCTNHLYLINPNLTQDAVAELYKQYEEVADFNPKNIVMFGYSFNEWSVTEMLEKNLKILESSEKNLTINIDVRY